MATYHAEPFPCCGHFGHGRCLRRSRVRQALERGMTWTTTWASDLVSLALWPLAALIHVIRHQGRE